MGRPHAALVELAAGRPPPAVPAAEAAELLESALDHRMQGLLWTRVEQREVELPRDELHALAREQLRIRAHNLRLWQALLDVVRELRALGIEVATAKGVTAEQRWYDRPGERPSNDVDLLLDPGQLHRIEEIVAALTPGHPLRGELHALFPSGLLQSVDLEVGGVEIDLHADLLKFEVPARQVDVVWQHTLLLPAAGGAEIRVLDASLSLVHFLLHLNKDRFSRLLGFADVAKVLEREQVDWGVVERFARGEGLLVPIASSLEVVVGTLGLDAPPLTPSGLRARVWQALWPPDSRLRGTPGLVHDVHRQLWLPWLARGRALEALRWWIRRRVLPPRPLVPLYYPGTSGGYLWRLLSGRVSTARRRARMRRSVGASRPLEQTAYKTFPPKWAHIRVPLQSRSSALSALALYSPCQRKGYLTRDVAWFAVQVMGPHVLPGRSRPLEALAPAAVWHSLQRRWREQLGPFDGLAAYVRPQKSRSGFAVLLLRDGVPTAFLRVRAGDSQFSTEFEVLSRLSALGATPFWFPRPLAREHVDGWGYLALSPLPPQRHTACDLGAAEGILSTLHTLLDPGPRPTTHPDWQPMHGDFTPWNCRRLRGGEIAILDWEDAGWGPPGADAVLYRATLAAMEGSRPQPAAPEVTDFWRERLAARLMRRPGEPLTVATLEALDQMGRASRARIPDSR